MAMTGQSRFETNFIPPTARRILWVNETAPSLGDALMDTSARCLLQGRTIHLLTSNKNAGLFQGDDYFDQVFDDARQPKELHQECPYDLAILDSFSPRTITKKREVCADLPFVGLYGYLNGFEVHRTLFSYHRLGKLLGLDLQDIKGRRVVHHALGRVPATDSSCEPHPKPRIAVGIGGEWDFRTYKHWQRFIASVAEAVPDIQITLLGSTNGRSEASLLKSGLSRKIYLRNCVGSLSLYETCSELRRSDLYVGADGGLWHMASGCGIPTVALFADCALFDGGGQRVSRASPDQSCISLSVDSDVSQIDPCQVVDAVRRSLSICHRVG
jgi:Glycosyltransferase family 9 (heptosyltransferase)